MDSIRVDAERLAAAALDVLRRPWPHKLDHLILHAEDRPLPADIHPVFRGCYDWHSSVHMHWSLLRLRSWVDRRWRSEIDAHFDAHFTPSLVERERAYAAEPGRGAFERPYGWAWLLKLQSELEAQAAPWALALAPFASDVAGRFGEFIGRSPYPVRWGTHANSAFAMLLARDFAVYRADARLREAIDGMARDWFGRDEDYPAKYEPSGADFLSGGLCEALLMSRVLGDGFAAWWSRFDRDGAATQYWLAPAIVSDRTDPQIVHLDGLNLSRAWCLRAIADRLPDAQRAAVLRAADAHWQAGRPHVMSGDFVATHWLLSFALLSVDRS